MNIWFTIWAVIALGSLLAALGLGICVAVEGLVDIRTMFRRMNEFNEQAETLAEVGVPVQDTSVPSSEFD